ncbi:hypothetical protein Gotur_007473 [Gossypium turneri]
MNGVIDFRGSLGSISSKKTVMAVAISLLLVASLLGSSCGCHFPAIYNLGDSNSDTGSVSATFGRVPWPCGESFFGKPAGRYSDGRLIIDFIANELKLPFLSAYLDAIDSNFRHGANFAASGSTIQPADDKLFDTGFNPLSLEIQLLQFQQLKERSNELYDQAKNPDITDRLPRPEEFSKSLYILDCGQNDLHYGIITSVEDQFKAFIPNKINQFAAAVEKLFQQGARVFWIHNTGPIGCLPTVIINFPPKPGNVDQAGCIKSYNELAQEFNKQLKDTVSQLKAKLPGARLIYVDIYSAKFSLISEANKYGFVDPFVNCCGDHHVECGKTAVVNGTEIFGASCSDPSKHISWDGIHYTEAANYWVVNRILDGSLSDPPLPITEACPLQISDLQEEGQVPLAKYGQRVKYLLVVNLFDKRSERISMEGQRPSVGNGIIGRWKTAWASRNSVKTLTIAAFFAVAFSLFILSGRQRNLGGSGTCDFPAVFNFGDSNSDTGGKSAAFQRIPLPNGNTFFQKPSGRYCNGELIIDFIGQSFYSF